MNMPWDNTDVRWLELGVMDEDPHVLELPGYDNASRYAGVILVGDSYVQCRIANVGAGSLRGVFSDPRKGDQVLVVFPGGRANSGVVLGALHSDAAPYPAAADTDRTSIIDPRGVQIVVSSSPTPPPEPSDGRVTVYLDAGQFVELILTVGSDPDFALRSTTFLSDLKLVLDEVVVACTAAGVPSVNTSAMILKIAASLTSVNLPYRSRNLKVD